jgi:hypothetical protein
MTEKVIVVKVIGRVKSRTSRFGRIGTKGALSRYSSLWLFKEAYGSCRLFCKYLL